MTASIKEALKFALTDLNATLIIIEDALGEPALGQRQTIAKVETALASLSCGEARERIARIVCDGMSNGNIQLDDANETLKSDCLHTADSILATGCIPREAESEYVYDDPRFNKGVQHVVDLIARELGATDWVAGDGSEDYDCDLWQTILNILAAKSLYDADQGEFAVISTKPDEASIRAELAEARQEAADSLAVLDAIADYVGCPHDEELTVDHVRKHYMKLENAAQRQGIEDAGRIANAQAYSAGREASICADWNTTGWDRARNSGRILLVWREFAGVSEHVELGRYSDSKAAWVNTYGHPFHAEPDGWALLLPFKAAEATRADEREKQKERDAKVADDMASDFAAGSLLNPDVHIAKRVAQTIAAAIRAGRGEG